ncbi:MAG: ABC transporter permease [Sphaerochaetaceae bacterium]|jgi:ABC-2 type transport system permease protein|nr:ABC transporter permease [Sphaerochaetaceae bacterium]MDD3942277.1 ABC transporter permease [Sphaerochaetaceae bacterium]MDX9939892.1 ABC transporter permease [Sphaerochaetaceae bacterium]
MKFYAFAIKEDLRHPVNSLLILLLPIPLLFIPANAGSYPFGISLYGMVIMYSSFLLSRPVAEDRMHGIITRIAASPVRPFTYLASHLLGYLTLLGIQMSLFMIGSMIAHGDAVHGRLPILSLYLSFSIMCLALSLSWNTLFRSFNISFGLFAGLASLLCLVGGVSIPLFLLPRSIIGYIMFLPTYWLPHGLDAIHAGDMVAFWQSHAILLVFASIFLLIGSKRRF